MTEDDKKSMREFVRHWRRVGPLLEQVRIRELQELDPESADPLIEDRTGRDCCSVPCNDERTGGNAAEISEKVRTT